jgi:hypothetical protein
VNAAQYIFQQIVKSNKHKMNSVNIAASWKYASPIWTQ